MPATGRKRAADTPILDQAVPLESKGRNVARVFAHMHHVRYAWGKR